MAEADTPGPLAAVPATILPFTALLVGAVAMGASPIFVRLADVGPFASAFWRVALAVPVLYVWAVIEARAGPAPTASVFRMTRPILLAGLFFTGDLFFWHLAIVNTSVANATLLATLAPVWVALGSGLFIREVVPRPVFLGLLLCLGGAGALIGTSATFNPGRLAGDLYGFITSIFFGAYFLAVRSAGRTARPGRIIFLTSTITAVLLLAVALTLESTILPHTPRGIAALIALALVSHVGGQGLLIYALGHLPAAFSALVIFLEAIAAAAFGWYFLSEAVVALQFAGGALILAGIAIARPRRAATPPVI